MRDHEGIFSGMNAVIYYSNTNQSKKIAAYFAAVTGFSLWELGALTEYVFDRAVLVFPVYCQNIPEAVTAALRKFHVKRLAVIATYGRMSYGNVLYELQRAYTNGEIVAAAYVPTKHSYLQENGFEDFQRLGCIADKVKMTEAEAIEIPPSFKNPFADFAKEWRSRVGVKLWRGENCVRCGKCEKGCPYGAIVNGKFNRRCIRCLKCATNCPVGAIRFFNRLPLRLYLKKKKIDELILYI